MMKRLILIVFVLTATCGSISAQHWDTVWTVTGQTPLNKYFKKWRFDFNLDARNSFQGGTDTRIFGIRAGLQYRRVHRFGIGIYGMTNPWFPREYLTTEAFEGNDLLYRLNYATLYYERVLYFSRKWEFSASAHIGSGSIDVERRKNRNVDFQPYEKIIVQPVEGIFTGYYNIFWWFSAGAGFGYRYMPHTPVNVEDEFLGNFYMIKMKLKIGKLARSIFDKDVKHEY